MLGSELITPLSEDSYPLSLLVQFVSGSIERNFESSESSAQGVNDQ